MNKRSKILILAALACAMAAIGATVVGYQDWQFRAGAPSDPGSGYLRTWADTPSGLIKCMTPAGAACYFATNTSSSLELQTNGTNNGSQALYNAIAGSNMTITDNGSGGITFASSGGSGITLETNGTANGSQTLLNLFAGTGMSLADNGSGKITLTNTAASPTIYHAIGMNFGIGGGAAIAAGQVAYVTVPFACTIDNWAATVDAGTITYDIWKITTGTAIPTVTNTITAASYPAVSTGTAANGVGSGWTTGVNAFDIFGFYVRAAATATTSSIVLKCAGGN